MASPQDGTPPRDLPSVISETIAPLVARDGGEVEWLGLEDGVAEIALRGACVGCPGQSFTLHEVVLPALQAVDPSVRSVRARRDL